MCHPIPRFLEVFVLTVFLSIRNYFYIYFCISFYLTIKVSFDLIVFLSFQRYEPYLWENERQSYLRHAVLFGFYVQLNRMYTDTVQKLPTNSESNIMRCSTVPRFKYLPIRLVFYPFSFSCP